MKLTHTCPKHSCLFDIPEGQFACRFHWWRLPADIRQAITDTADLNLLHPRRRKAIVDAMEALNP